MRCLSQSKIPDKFFLKCVRNAEKYEKIVFCPNLQEGELFLTQGIIYPLFQTILFFATLLQTGVGGLMQLDKIWTYLDKSGSFCVDFPRNHQLKN